MKNEGKPLPALHSQLLTSHPPHSMNERLQAIADALQFVESRLRDPITVADIAAAAGYSLYHFIRTFNQTVQHTPYDYLMRRRLTEAARELLENERRVIDIALDFQFNNHETFTRAFRRVLGLPPTHWREQGIADPRFLMPALNAEYLEYLNTPDFEAPKLVGLEGIFLAGLMSPVTADHDGIASLWRNLRGALRGLPLNQGPRDFWGIRIQPQMPDGSAFYFAGVKTPVLESALSTFVTKIIPAGDYVCLKQKNPDADLEFALTYLYHTILPKAGYRLAAPLEIEHFGTARELLIPVQASPQKSNFAPAKG